MFITDTPWEKGVRQMGERIPISLAARGAGESAWLRDVLCRCPDCNAVVKLGDTEGERCVCATCWDSTLDETAAMDQAQA